MGCYVWMALWILTRQETIHQLAILLNIRHGILLTSMHVVGPPVNADDRMILQPTLLRSKIAYCMSWYQLACSAVCSYLTLRTVIVQWKFYSRHLSCAAGKAAYGITKQQNVSHLSNQRYYIIPGLNFLPFCSTIWEQ